jgi:hypothetical protein
MTMAVNYAGSINSAREAERLATLRLAQRLATFLGLAGAAAGLPGLDPSSAAAQTAPYQSAGEAPAAWRDYAVQLRNHFVQQLVGNRKVAAKLANSMSHQNVGTAVPSGMVTLRAWVSPIGKVQRVEFDGIEGDAAAELRDLFTKDDVGVPPSGMLQPMQLRFLLHQNPEKQGQPARQ